MAVATLLISAPPRAVDPFHEWEESLGHGKTPWTLRHRLVAAAYGTHESVADLDVVGSLRIVGLFIGIGGYEDNLWVHERHGLMPFLDQPDRMPGEEGVRLKLPLRIMEDPPRLDIPLRDMRAQQVVDEGAPEEWLLCPVVLLASSSAEPVDAQRVHIYPEDGEVPNVVLFEQTTHPQGPEAALRASILDPAEVQFVLVPSDFPILGETAQALPHPVAGDAEKADVSQGGLVVGFNFVDEHSDSVRSLKQELWFQVQFVLDPKRLTSPNADSQRLTQEAGGTTLGQG